MGDDAVLGGIGLDDLEFNCSPSSSSDEGVAFADWAVGCERASASELVLVVRRHSAQTDPLGSKALGTRQIGFQ